MNNNVFNIGINKLYNFYNYLKSGTLEITCEQTGLSTILNFRPYSRSNKDLHRFDGFIYDNK